MTFPHFSGCEVDELFKCSTIRIFSNKAGVKDAVEHDAVNTLNILTPF